MRSFLFILQQKCFRNLLPWTKLLISHWVNPPFHMRETSVPSSPASPRHGAVRRIRRTPPPESTLTADVVSCFFRFRLQTGLLLKQTTLDVSQYVLLFCFSVVKSCIILTPSVSSSEFHNVWLVIKSSVGRFLLMNVSQRTFRTCVS